MSGDTKSKFAAAVNGAKEKAAAQGETAPQPGGQQASFDGAADLLVRKKVSEEEAKRFMSGANVEFAPQNYSMVPGDYIEGLLEGYGPDAEFENKQPDGTVITNQVRTYIIQQTGGPDRVPMGPRISILGSVMLDRKMDPFVGGFVQIFRGDDIRSTQNPAFKVGNYQVAGEKIEGVVRVFSSRLPPGRGAAGQLPAAVVHAQLPAQAQAQAHGEDQHA